jgi:hypothetical protein
MSLSTKLCIIPVGQAQIISLFKTIAASYFATFSQTLTISAQDRMREKGVTDGRRFSPNVTWVSDLD